MHIEPGVLHAAKVLYANAAAGATLLAFAPKLLSGPETWARTILAALFFSFFMEVFHLPVGVSELHFIGASAVYLTFGLVPTLFGFALGLLLQGLLFEPQDLVHLGVNSLSLILPLLLAHVTLGRRFFRKNGWRLCWSQVVRFDALYYSGVVAMVGFWIALGEEPAPLRQWGIFALSYLPVVLCEPLLTCLVLRWLKGFSTWPLLGRLTCVPGLSL